MQPFLGMNYFQDCSPTSIEGTSHHYRYFIPLVYMNNIHIFTAKTYHVLYASSNLRYSLYIPFLQNFHNVIFSWEAHLHGTDPWEDTSPVTKIHFCKFRISSYLFYIYSYSYSPFRSSSYGYTKTSLSKSVPWVTTGP